MSTPSDLKFLIVDDFSTMRRIVRGLLKEMGCNNAEEAEDGAVALNMLKSAKYDFVVSDINMPGMSGKELARLLHERLGKNCPRLIAYTAYSLPHQKQSIVDAGFDAIVVKPARPEDMLAAIAGDEPDAGR